MKKILILLVIVSGMFLSSHIAFAAWWSAHINPFSQIFPTPTPPPTKPTPTPPPTKPTPITTLPSAGNTDTSIPLGASVACSNAKMDEVLAPATPASPTVSVACRLDLKPWDKVTKQIIVRGVEASGTRVNCNNATIATTLNQHSIKVSSIKIQNPSPAFPAGKWSRPYDVLFTKCLVTGGISVEGIPTSNNPGIYQDSSRVEGHTKRVQDAAPSNISFVSMKITAQGKTPFYVSPGATNVSLISSVINGKTNGSVAVYLDAETSNNTIKNNIFDVDTLKSGITVKTPSVDISGLFCGIGTTHKECVGDNRWHCSWRGCYYSVKVCVQVPDVPYVCKKSIPPVVSYTLEYPYQREIIAVDGSANNKIIGNTFNNLFPGGIYIYRNCGEGGTVRHQTPHDNQIIGNIFNFNKTTDKPAVWVSSRDGGSPYCDADNGYSLGSSADNTDHADRTVIANNVISTAPSFSSRKIYMGSTLPGVYVKAGVKYKIGGSTLSNINTKAVEELKNAIVAVVGAVIGILANPLAAPFIGFTAPVAALSAPLTVPLGGVAFLFGGFLLPGGTVAAEILYDHYQVEKKTGSIVNPSGALSGPALTSEAVSMSSSPCYELSGNKLYAHGETRVVSGSAYLCKDGVWSSPLIGELSPMSDTSGKYQVEGWACLKKSATPSSVELYARSISGKETIVTSVVANATTTQAIDARCGTKGVPHTFSYRFSLLDMNTFKGQAIYARAMSGVTGIENEVLVGSGTVLPLFAPITKGAVR